MTYPNTETDAPTTSDLSRYAQLLREEAAILDYYGKQWGDRLVADLPMEVVARVLRSQATVELVAQMLYGDLWELLADSSPHAIADEEKRLGLVMAALSGRETIEAAVRASVRSDDAEVDG